MNWSFSTESGKRGKTLVDESKNLWVKALGEMRPGLATAKWESIIENATRKEPNIVRSIRVMDPVSFNRGDDAVKYLWYKCYILDERWEVVIQHTKTDQDQREGTDKLVQYWVVGLDLFRDEQNEDIFPLIVAIHDVTLPDDGGLFNPVTVVRAVNILHAAGFEESIRALKEYERLSRRIIEKDASVNLTKAFVGLDGERIFLIGSLLYVAKVNETNSSFSLKQILSGKGPLRYPGVGAIIRPSPLPQSSFYNVFVFRDLPFCVRRRVGVIGRPAHPESLVEFVEKDCRLRHNPLCPTSSPWDAVLEIRLSERDLAPANLPVEEYTAKLQVLHSLLSAADVERSQSIRKFLRYEKKLTEDEWRDFLTWFSSHGTFWDKKKMMYRVTTSSAKNLQ